MERALDHNLVTLRRSASLTRKVMAAAERAGKTPRIRVQVRSFDAMCRMVAAGFGLAVLPRAAAPLYARSLGLAVVELGGLDVERRLLVAMQRRESLSEEAAAFVAMLERASREAEPIAT